MTPIARLQLVPAARDRSRLEQALPLESAPPRDPEQAELDELLARYLDRA